MLDAPSLPAALKCSTIDQISPRSVLLWQSTTAGGSGKTPVLFVGMQVTEPLPNEDSVGIRREDLCLECQPVIATASLSRVTGWDFSSRLSLLHQIRAVALLLCWKL